MGKPTLIAIAVVEHNGQFLVGIRPPEADLAGYSEFPGGKVEPGELPAQAAIRECREETGLEVEVAGEFPEQVHRYDHDHVRLMFYHCRLNQKDENPHTPFQWVDRADLESLRFPAGNNAVLTLLQCAS
jgi:mutator protein MutT